MPNRILLKGDQTAVFEENIASEAITPGHLVQKFNNAGVAGLQLHNVEGGPHEKIVALEDALQGKTIDEAYAAADRVFYTVVPRGGVAYVYLKAAENVVIGDKLISAGDGTLIKLGSQATASEAHIWGAAEDALDLTATGAVNTRLAVRAF